MVKKFKPITSLDKFISEEDFQQTIISTARYLGWKVYHTHDSRRSESGYPDLTMVRDGRIIFVEVKREDGKSTTEQIAWQLALAESEGVEVYEFRPSEWDEILEVITRGTRPNRIWK